MSSTEQLQELITGAEVARRLNVSRQRVAQLRKTLGFPEPAGKVGVAVVWRAGDIAKYATGVRQLVVVNRVPLTIERATELAARLRRQGGPDLSKPEHDVASAIESLLEKGGSVSVSGDELVAVWKTLQKWLEDVGVDVFGEQLMSLRYRLHGELPAATPA